MNNCKEAYYTIIYISSFYNQNTYKIKMLFICIHIYIYNIVYIENVILYKDVFV